MSVTDQLFDFLTSFDQGIILCYIFICITEGGGKHVDARKFAQFSEVF